ncbi:MAG: hypothetical protein KGJ41_12425 [Rhodospirillales bacterium]|nr:hypothetical protein [Rhodospirillales bacterium]MDE2199815.1 hypothetical protein [Rhodospirillales bacterium]MDE2575398.1 hypothetical protein [Rhodospirillales bacterium]
MKRRSLSTFVFYDITYADGTRSSRRKVPSAVLEGLDGEAGARAAIEAQDREIVLASGRALSTIKTMVRSRT